MFFLGNERGLSLDFDVLCMHRMDFFLRVPAMVLDGQKRSVFEAGFSRMHEPKEDNKLTSRRPKFGDDPRKTFTKIELFHAATYAIGRLLLPHNKSVHGASRTPQDSLHLPQDSLHLPQVHASP